MSDKVELNESELGTVQGGLMTFYGVDNVLGYLQPDGTTAYYAINGSYDAAYKRSSALHVDTDDEDYILKVLQNEGYIGARLK